MLITHYGCLSSVLGRQCDFNVSSVLCKLLVLSKNKYLHTAASGWIFFINIEFCIFSCSVFRTTKLMKLP